MKGQAHVSTVNISFPVQLLKSMDLLAKEESRTRSELLREAARLYIERKRRWDKLMAMGRKHAKAHGFKPTDVARLITAYRRENKTR
ncbi:MAG: ribbon-helix-helix domain-containing protein [Elusimicrobiota bacterium]